MKREMPDILEPWKSESPKQRENLCERLSTIRGAEGGIVAYVVCDTRRNGEYHRRLVAAAPTLLRALSDLVQAIRADELLPDSVSFMREADAVLAFCRGEPGGEHWTQQTGLGSGRPVDFLRVGTAKRRVAGK